MAAPVGNQNARKAKLWEQAIKRALARKANSTIDGGLDLLADKLVAAAELGEQWAIKEVGDRIDGKAAQSLSIDGDGEGGPVKVEKIVREVVRANP